MEGIYDVTLGGEPVGKVFVDREGLYYRFRCRCCLTGDVMYRVEVCCGESRQNLGVLVPMEGDFGLQTRLAVKLFPQARPRFLAVPHRGSSERKFRPLSPQEPYAYIREMKQIFLKARREQKTERL